MKILQLASYLGNEANGVAPVVAGIARELSAAGNQSAVACLGKPDRIGNAHLHSAKRSIGPRRLEISWALCSYLWNQRNNFDVIHNHGLWSMINIFAGLVLPSARAILVTSPHGTLSTWALGRSRLVKSLVWPIQRLALSRADLIHVTSQEEYLAVRNQGFKAPVAVLPNGVEVPPLPEVSQKSQQKTLLFLGRLHPVKGLDNLLDAWFKIENSFKDWRLCIAGSGDADYATRLHKKVCSSISKRVEFVGPLYGKDKYHAFFDADLFVLPTFSENFGVAVAEAMAHGCPVIVGKGAPWSDVVEKKCGWWVDNDVETLAAALTEAMSLDRDHLSAMGKRGREWMAQDYAWPAIARDLSIAYRWVNSRTIAPSFVKVS